VREIELVEPLVGRSDRGVHPLVYRLDVRDQTIKLCPQVLQLCLFVVA
jgi:hypothetical protein